MLVEQYTGGVGECWRQCRGVGEKGKRYIRLGCIHSLAEGHVRVIVFAVIQPWLWHCTSRRHQLVIFWSGWSAFTPPPNAITGYLQVIKKNLLVEVYYFIIFASSFIIHYFHIK